MSNEINIGDLVKLKSGGQEMIVKKYYLRGEKIDKNFVVCVWHNLLGDNQEEVYPIVSLVKV